jgi:hypothetical protein
VQRFGVKEKLAPRSLWSHGEVRYGCLPYSTSAVHDVFHVSQLKRCEQISEAQIIEETNAEIEQIYR